MLFGTSQKSIKLDLTPRRVEAVSVIVLLLKHKASRYAARGYLIRENNGIDLKIESSQLLCDQSISSSLSVCPCLFSFLTAESIQGHSNVFLEGEQTPGGPASQTSSETKTEGGGGGGEGGRRASVTSVESEMSICSMGQLGNTIANSEWEGRRSTTVLRH